MTKPTTPSSQAIGVNLSKPKSGTNFTQKVGFWGKIGTFEFKTSVLYHL